MRKRYTNYLLPLLFLLIAAPFGHTHAQSCVGQPLFPAGTYTINSTLPTSGTNYHSFGDAVNAISCGIAGPVIFNCAPNTGPYNEQVLIPVIANTSATNTVTFNGNGDTVTFNATLAAQSATIKLLGAHNITLNNLVVIAGTQNMAYGIHLMSDADSNKVLNCTVISDRIGQTIAGSAGILINGSATNTISLSNSYCDKNLISGNTIIGGYVSISLPSTATGKTKGNQIVNNIIQDYCGYGIYSANGDSTFFEGNDISRPARNNSATTSWAIYLAGGSTRVKVSKNRIYNLLGNIDSTNIIHGISLNLTAATVGNENEISNNLVYTTRGKSTFYGLYCGQSPNSRFYHNTVSIDDTASINQTGANNGIRGFFSTGTSTNVIFQNNVISVGRAGSSPKYCVYVATTAGVTLDHNVYFMHASSGSSVALGNWGGVDKVTLADWQSASAQENNSVAVDPMYQNPANGNFKPTQPAVNNIGMPLSITTDILGVIRSTLTPDPGAYEFGNICDTSQHIYASAITTSSATLSWNPVPASLGYQYLVNQTATAPATGSGTATTDTFYNASNLTAGGTYYIHVRTSCSGNNFSDWKTLGFTLLCNNPTSFTLSSANGNINFCPADSLKLHTNVTGSNLSFAWSLGGNPIPGATDSVYYAHNGGTYGVTVSTTPYCSHSENIVLNTYTPPVATTMPTSVNICEGTTAVLEANNTAGISYQWQKNGADISGATSYMHVDSTDGNYTVIETDMHNCRDTSDVIPFTLMSTPTAAISAASLQFCSGDSVILTAPIANSYTYTWFSGSNPISNGPSNTLAIYNGGTYSVAVTQGQCSDTSDTIIIVEKPLPAPVISQTGVTLATGLFSSYQWYQDGVVIPGATNQSYDVTANGTYSVEVSDTSGCSNKATAVTMTGVGINAVTAPNGISVYPNPVTDILMIDAPKAINAQLMGLDGKVVAQQNNVHRLEMNTLPNGTYILRISDSNGQLLFSTSVIKKSN